MSVSYGRLVEDHERIEVIANAVLSEARALNPSPTNISDKLSALRFTVGEHLELERTIIDACSELRLAKSWAELMQTGQDDFQALCSDWQIFLSDWSPELVAADLDGFRFAAEDVLARLRQRVQAETRALYATGLQVGVITLKAGE